MADKKNQQAVLAYFDSESAAHEAAKSLQAWDKESGHIEIGQIGLLSRGDEGKIKKELLERQGWKGVGIGIVLGAIVAALSGPVGWGALAAGAVGGGIVGHFVPKRVAGVSKEAIQELGESLDKGQAVVAVLVEADQAEAVHAELLKLGGKAQAHEVSEADIKEAETVATAQPESQQLVAGVFATKAAFDAVAPKIKAMGPQLQLVNASNLLVLAKGEDGKVHVDVIDIGSSAGIDLSSIAERVVADVDALSGNTASNPASLTARASHLGLALNPGAVAIGMFVDKQYAPKVADGIGKLGAQLLTADDLKRIGAGLGAVVGANDLAAKAAIIAPTAAPAPPPVFDWHAEYAYSLALQAFIYGFPYVYNALTRYKWTNVAQDTKHVAYAPVSKFWHASEVTDASWREGGCPNNDTAYSLAWVDLSQGPVILTIPAIPSDRYWTMELVDFASDNFAYVGHRQGTPAGHYGLVGPNWEGVLPEGVTRIEPDCPTPWLLIAGRTVVNGVEDLPAVHAIQAGYKLTPLSYWGKPEAEIPDRRDVYKPAAAALGADDPLGAWKTLNAMLAENPPPAHHAILLKQFADIGIGPGLDVEQQPQVVKDALQRAAAKGMLLLRQQFMSGIWATIVNGWRYPPFDEGRLGDKFLMRAADQSLAGICANDPVEAVYLVNLTDDQDEPLTGAHKYELTFPKGMTPPVDAFWSLTVYGTDYNLVPNAINRYSIGDRTPGVQKNADGSTTFYFQAEAPGADKESNWLPTGAEGWFPILRMYMPHPDVVAAKWECPPLKRVD